MLPHDPARSRRLLAACGVAGMLCAAATIGVLLDGAADARVLGIRIGPGLTASAALAATVLCATGVAWLRARRQEKRITVRELRRQAGYPR